MKDLVDTVHCADALLVTDVTAAIMNVQRGRLPESQARQHEFTSAQLGLIQRIDTRCHQLAAALHRLEHEHGLLDLYPDEWLHMTGSRCVFDEWRDGLLLVGAECAYLLHHSPRRRRGRPKNDVTLPLALGIAEILTRHGVDLMVSRGSTPFTQLLLRSLELAGERVPRDPFRLLQRLSRHAES